MCHVYLTEPGVKVSKSGGRLIVAKNGEELCSLPLDSIDTISIFTTAHLSYDVITYIMCRGAQIFYVDRKGFISGTLSRDTDRTLLLLKQLHAMENEKMRLEIGKNILRNKLRAQYKLLKGYNKNIKNPYLKKVMETINTRALALSLCTNIDSLRGVEGIVAQEYFGCFGYLISNPDFIWTGRNKHPPRDPINAMLSYGYTLLEKDVRYLLASKGLDCGIGYIHTTDGRKDSLVYDVMEPFRSAIVDKLVLKLINLKSICLADFEVTEEGCYFTRPGLKTFISSYEEYAGGYEDGLRKGIGSFINDLKFNFLQVKKYEL